MRATISKSGREYAVSWAHQYAEGTWFFYTMDAALAAARALFGLPEWLPKE